MADQQPGETSDKEKELATSVEDLTSKDKELNAFCTTLTLQRYLRARSNDVTAASKMLRKTLEWRRDYRPQDISFQEIKELAATGRLEVLDHRDLQGRSVLCYRLSRLNVMGKSPELHLRFMLFNLEAASQMADENGVGKMTWLMDMDNYDNSQSIPLMTTRRIISILQNHYPERLGIILIMRANRVFRALFFVIKHFLDPVTREKLNFLNDIDDSKMKARLLEHLPEELIEGALSCRRPDDPFNVEKYERRMTGQEKPVANGSARA